MDLLITRWIAENFHNPFLDRVMPFITTLGDYGVFWILLTVILLLFKRTRRMGIVCALALLIAYLTGELILKNIFQRARPFTHLPELQLLIAPPGSHSFPSGHSGSSFAAATAIFLSDRKWGIAALVLAALIAFSRLYLSVHYLTDVLAGTLLGIASAFAAKWIFDHRFEARGR